MSVRPLDAKTVALEGVCPSEDAEVLLRHLLATPGLAVDWRACETAHAAVIQVLMASSAKVVGRPAGRFLRDMVEPSLRAG